MGNSVEARKIISRGITETISISDSIDVAKGLYFELTEPVIVPGIKKSTSSMELRFDDTDKNKLIAFTIWVTGSSLQDNTLAYQTAYRFTNFLTLKTGMFIFHKRPREIRGGNVSNIWKSPGSAGISNRLVTLDITNSHIHSLLNQESILNQKLAHFSNGCKAIEAANFIEAIKDFFMVIEKEMEKEGNVYPNLSRFKFLRHGVSHLEINDHQTINELEKMGLVCKEYTSSTRDPKGKYLDITDPHVQAILEREIKNFQVELIQYLDYEVNTNTN